MKPMAKPEQSASPLKQVEKPAQKPIEKQLPKIEPAKEQTKPIVVAPKAPVASISNKPEVKLSFTSQLSASLKTLSRNYIPTSTALPCREAERQELVTMLETHLSQGKGTAAFVYGKPGTGKTVSIVKLVKEEAKTHKFEYCEINCMEFKNPDVIYSLLCNASSEDRTSVEDRINELEKKYTTSSKKQQLTVVILDECERLMASKKAVKVLEKLLNWANSSTSKLILIGIANQSNMAEALGQILKGQKLAFKYHICYKAYTAEHLSEIIKDRLAAANSSSLFDAPALQLLSAKCQQVGDARTVLDVAKKTLENVLEQVLQKVPNRKESVTIADVNNVCKQFFTASAVIQGIQGLTFHQQLLVCACLKLTKHEKKQFNQGMLVKYYLNICKDENLPPVPKEQLLDMCTSLHCKGLINIGNKKKIGAYTGNVITVNVAEDDAKTALKDVRICNNVLTAEFKGIRDD